MASDFLSLANDDATARNTIEVITHAGLKYQDLVFWNAIPWSGPRDEKISQDMISRGASMLNRLLPLLPCLKAVVLVGGEAQRLKNLIKWSGKIRVFECAHPGPFVWNQHRYRNHKMSIFSTFQAAAEVIRD
jgi:hypothetical protein